MGVAQNERPRVAQVLVFGSICQGAILVHLLEPQPNDQWRAVVAGAHCTAALRLFVAVCALMSGGRCGFCLAFQLFWGGATQPALAALAAKGLGGSNTSGARNPDGNFWATPWTYRKRGCQSYARFAHMYSWSSLV